MAEQAAHNRLVKGSNPRKAEAHISFCIKRLLRRGNPPWLPGSSEPIFPLICIICIICTVFFTAQESGWLQISIVNVPSCKYKGLGL